MSTIPNKEQTILVWYKKTKGKQGHVNPRHSQ